ncbi:MAG: winged helix-turn-helix transcriptional regulator [Planctomycetes bacterium]|nr:winged helix-turn-helix transcriptional regulator [Planctomycetota bacterium]
MDRQQARLYEMKAQVIKALAHPIRLAIVDYLKDGEQCVCDIAEHVGSERSNVSRHLSVMVKAGVLQHRKDGLMMFYSLRTPCVVNFFRCVEGVLREQIKSDAALLKDM